MFCVGKDAVQFTKKVETAKSEYKKGSVSVVKNVRVSPPKAGRTRDASMQPAFDPDRKSGLTPFLNSKFLKTQKIT
jgi:hypothetical protein